MREKRGGDAETFEHTQNAATGDFCTALLHTSAARTALKRLKSARDCFDNSLIGKLGYTQVLRRLSGYCR